jgi:hypothetical protein
MLGWIVAIMLVSYMVGSFCVKKFMSYSKSIKVQREVSAMCLEIPETENIFVILPTYRDLDCAATLFDLFHQSSCPDRIFVGLCIQNYKTDIDPVKAYINLGMEANLEKTYEYNIRVYRLDPENATGYWKAQFCILNHLYKNEKYIMHIHSHTILVRHWDKLCRTEFRNVNQIQSGNMIPLLTTRLNSFESHERHSGTNDDQLEIPTFTKFSHFKSKKDSTQTTAYVPIFVSDKYKEVPQEYFASLFWSSQFSFTLGNPFVTRVLQSAEHLSFFDYLDTEAHEFLLGIVLWTQNFNFFTPTKTIARHRLFKDSTPMFIKKKWKEQFDHPVLKKQRHRARKDSWTRYNNFLQRKNHDSSSRSIESYLKMCGLDLQGNLPKAALWSQLGMMRNANAKEMIVKFGSLKL